MSEVKNLAQGKFCWIDLGTTDQESAIKFYSELFGWSALDAPMGDGQVYSMMQLGGKNVGGIYTLNKEQQAQNIPAHWMSYIAVDNVNEVAAKVEGLGGTLMMKPFDVFDSGRMAIVQDPTGAVVSLWQTKRPDEIFLIYEHGTLCWNELMTTDVEKAGDFYANLLNYTKNVQNMGAFDYTTFMVGEEMAGGMMAITEEMGPIPPNWGIYFSVEDCDKTVEKAKSLGSKIVVPPTDIPTVGRFSTLMDPQGAVFSVIKMEPQS